MTKEKILVKRQNIQNVCQLALVNSVSTGKLMCCENNGTCIASPQTCSSTNKLGFDPCIRNDSAAQVVCQHTDGIYCLKGNTD